MNLNSVIARILRIPGVPLLWHRTLIGPVDLRVRFDVWKRPHYAYGVFEAADLAKRLGLPAVSAIEFGVAAGEGLLEMENVARQVGEHFGIRISVFGFDTGEGMPAPADYRDLPYIWAKNMYKMDVEALRNRLTSATLMLGDVERTVSEFLATNRAPIGFVAFDLDYYSSTKHALRVFDGKPATHLPRVYCYFDETIGPDQALQNIHIGELRAIEDYNADHDDRKVCPINGLRDLRWQPAGWNDKMYAMHDFGHPLYCRNLYSAG